MLESKPALHHDIQRVPAQQATREISKKPSHGEPGGPWENVHRSVICVGREGVGDPLRAHRRETVGCNVMDAQWPRAGGPTSP